MAALTSSGVTINDVWYNGDRQRTLKCVDVTLVLSSQGGLTNYIGASLFGMSSIKESSGFRDSSSVAVATGPSYDGTKLVTYAIETNGNPADKSVTIRGVVRGTE